MSEVLDVTQVYKDLHQTPELGFEEVQTSKYIAKHLKAMGYEVHEGIGKTGVVAYERSNATRSHGDAPCRHGCLTLYDQWRKESYPCLWS